MAIKTVEDLRDFLSQEFGRIRTGDSTPASANAVSNLAGKMLSSVKIELEYNKMVGSSPKIDFLTANENKQKKLEKPK